MVIYFTPCFYPKLVFPLISINHVRCKHISFSFDFVKYLSFLYVVVIALNNHFEYFLK